MQLALNFQLLDAEFFLYAALGKGLDDIAPGLFQGPASVGARIANLDGTIRRIIEEFGYQGVGDIRPTFHIFHNTNN
ncbi:hypothetical protein QQP08_000678 [Theobroma cacao]|nr:hypothetical protein QQP08_000678 [Theobroma cacao]